MQETIIIIILVVLVLLIVFGFYIVLKQIDSIQENIYVQKTEIDNISKSLDNIAKDLNELVCYNKSIGSSVFKTHLATISINEDLNNLTNLHLETCKTLIEYGKTISAISKDLRVVKYVITTGDDNDNSDVES